MIMRNITHPISLTIAMTISTNCPNDGDNEKNRNIMIDNGTVDTAKNAFACECGRIIAVEFVSRVT